MRCPLLSACKVWDSGGSCHVLFLFFSEPFFNFGPIINEFQKGHFLGHPVEYPSNLTLVVHLNFVFLSFSDLRTPQIKDELS